MDEEHLEEMKNLIKKASEVAETAPDKFQLEAFKAILEKMLSTYAKTAKFEIDTLDVKPVDGSVGNDFDTQSSTSKLAIQCNLNEVELRNVITIKDKSVGLVYVVKDQKDSFRQIVGALITLLSHEVLFNEINVKSKTLGTSLRNSGIPDKGGNLSTNLKTRSDLFIVDSNSGTYSLTTSIGKTTAQKIFNKLAKRIPVIPDDLKTE